MIVVLVRPFVVTASILGRREHQLSVASTPHPATLTAGAIPATAMTSVLLFLLVTLLSFVSAPVGG